MITIDQQNQQLTQKQKEQILDKLISQLEHAKFKPNYKCTYCFGTGVRRIKRDENSGIDWIKIGLKPCSCINSKDKNKINKLENIFDDIAKLIKRSD